MKKGGIKLTAPTDTVVFSRGDNVLAFHIEGLGSMDEFDKLVMTPQPPTIRKPNGATFKDEKDATYLAKLEDMGKLRMAYIVIKSLANDDLEWEQVDPANPDTWERWQAELEEAGLTVFERNFLLGKILAINGIGTDDIYAKVRDDFLANQRAKTLVPPPA